MASSLVGITIKALILACLSLLGVVAQLEVVFHLIVFLDDREQERRSLARSGNGGRQNVSPRHCDGDGHLLDVCWVGEPKIGNRPQNGLQQVQVAPLLVAALGIGLSLVRLELLSRLLLFFNIFFP